MRDIYLRHFENWQLGRYGEISQISPHVRSHEEVVEFINILIALLNNAKDWEKYLSYFAAGASAFYKNPSFAFFYENEKIRNEIKRRMKKDNVPKKTEVEQELFDVFVANIEHNLDVRQEFIPALLRSLMLTESYKELYDDYLSYYLRLYFNTLKISDAELALCKEIVVGKIQKWGKPSEEEQNVFCNVVETFGVESYEVKKTEEEISKKKFLFFNKKEIVKKIEKTPVKFEELLQKLIEDFE